MNKTQFLQLLDDTASYTGFVVLGIVLVITIPVWILPYLSYRKLLRKNQ